MKKLILIAMFITACGQKPQNATTKAIAGPESPLVPTPHALVGTWIAQDYSGSFTFTETSGSDSMCGWNFTWVDAGSNTIDLHNLTTVDQDYPCDPAVPSNMHYQDKVCSVYFWSANSLQMTCLYNGSHMYVRQ